MAKKSKAAAAVKAPPVTETEAPAVDTFRVLSWEKEAYATGVNGWGCVMVRVDGLSTVYTVSAWLTATGPGAVFQAVIPRPFGVALGEPYTVSEGGCQCAAARHGNDNCRHRRILRKLAGGHWLRV